MSTNLVIVESPAKAKTIKKYLGKDFEVMASYGHVRDLVPKEGAVDPDHDFDMKYQVIDKNKKHVDGIRKAMAKADALYLATDPDREGEAISWHLHELLKGTKALDDKPVHRVVFHEITKKAIQDAIAHPRGLSMDLVEAQQARRALDYLVGFNLSPLLWKKIKPGLSAGRVQSAALRMIVEREEEIEQFEPREYWKIEAQTKKDSATIPARLTHLAGEKLKQFSINNEQAATEARNAIRLAADGSLKVQKVERKQRRRNPAPPFTTSTLQQEAVRKLGFTASRAMRVAQQLYEGIDIGQGSVGLITYMRTDSLNLADEAVAELRELIGDRYGAENVPGKPRVYKAKSKNAQEAHEAIRPTAAANTPEQVKPHLTSDQFRLYELIWKRTVACQMIHATMDTVSVDLAAGNDHLFRASGSTIRHPGFMAVYMEGKDDESQDAGKEKTLPPLEEGESLKLDELNTTQHFTEPPPRYTEASLVKTLEEYGIGRPSTYASIISTLLNREYVELDSRRFLPTDVGRIVNGFLAEHFTHYVDFDFTARLEDELDAVSRGEEDWIPLLRNFWKPFKEQVEEKDKNLTRADVAKERQLGTDPKSGKPISVRLGRYGPFVQMGSRDDEEKPRFASLRPGQKLSTITLEEALELFKLPRELGETPEGEKVSTNIGRFGPYVKYDKKFVSLGPDDDPYTIDLERALELVAEKKQADANRTIHDFQDVGIRVLRGRYGPYITDGKKNVRVPKDREPESLTKEECQELIEKAPAKKRRGGRRRRTKSN